MSVAANLTEVRLHGALGARFGRSHFFDVQSPAEAIRALCFQIRGFKRYLAEEHSLPGYRVFAGSEGLTAEQLQMRTSRKVLRIVPAVAGAGGVAKIIAGVILVIVGAILSYFGFGIGAPLMKMGVSLIISGAVDLIFAPPKPPPTGTQEAANNQPSYSFNGAVNTSGQGNPVPVLYGRLRVGSQVISAGIVTEQTT